MMKAESRYRGGVQVLGGGLSRDVLVCSVAGCGEGRLDGCIPKSVEEFVLALVGCL